MRANKAALPAALLACGTVACASGVGTPAAPAAPMVVSTGQTTLIPPGHGTLKQDEVTVSLRSGTLLIKVTPLSEHIIRLTAPDTYARLHGLAESRREAAEAETFGTPELFLVSFFSYQPDVAFQPQDLQLVRQGHLLRPLTIVPVTSGWGRPMLQQQESQTGVYAFEGPIDYDQPFTVRYDMMETDGWNALIPKLREERNRVESRAGGRD